MTAKVIKMLADINADLKLALIQSPPSDHWVNSPLVDYYLSLSEQPTVYYPSRHSVLPGRGSGERAKRAISGQEDATPSGCI
ncbi:Uncharacterised protein [uncultured archaeon]|nr:Uncharacterised protein [uncultured archaeon]